MRFRLFAVSAASAVALAAPPARAQGSAAGYQFTLVAAPSGADVQGLVFDGINNAGQVTGGITTRSGSEPGAPGPSFVYDAGAFRYFPAAYGVRGIDDAGAVVGTFNDAQGAHGFIDSDGLVRVFDGPDARPTDPGAFTVATGINGAGQVVGSEGNGRSASATHGYVYGRDGFTVFDTPFGGFTSAYGINNLGQVVGTYTTNGGLGFAGGFFRDADGTLRQLNAPGAVSTTPLGLNDLGDVVGSVLYSGSTVGSVGFVYRAGEFTLLAPPGPGRVTASGVNNAGVIVGTYYASSGDVYGFIATPLAATTAPEPATFALSAAGLAALGAGARRRGVRRGLV